MTTQTETKPIKIAIVGMTGSGKTVLISTLAMRMAQMALDDIFLSPFGGKRRQTLVYTQGNWKMLNNGQWPASTPAGELIDLQWELNTKNCQARVRFLDCAGQDIRSLFQTEYFDPDSLQGDLRRIYKNINSANVLIFLVNMKDLLATTDSGQIKEILDLDQMFYTLKQQQDIPRRMAVVFSQFDKYKPEVDMNFNGDFLEYVRYYLPYLHGQYIRDHNFELIPVAAVNNTRNVLEDGIVTQLPQPGFSSYNLEKLIHWMANSVEEIAKEIEEHNNNNNNNKPLEIETSVSPTTYVIPQSNDDCHAFWDVLRHAFENSIFRKCLLCFAVLGGLIGLYGGFSGFLLGIFLGTILVLCVPIFGKWVIPGVWEGIKQSSLYGILYGLIIGLCWGSIVTLFSDDSSDKIDIFATNASVTLIVVFFIIISVGIFEGIAKGPQVDISESFAEFYKEIIRIFRN